MGVNTKSNTLLTLVSKWAVSNSIIIPTNNNSALENHHNVQQSTSLLDLLPMRVIEELLSYQSASSLEHYYSLYSSSNSSSSNVLMNNNYNINLNNRKLMQRIVDQCFARLIGIQFGEPLIYSKLQTKQGQLLKEGEELGLSSLEDLDDEGYHITSYFESYLQKCLVNVLSERQIIEFVKMSDEENEKVNEDCVVYKEFLDLPIADSVLNLAFSEFDENNEIFHYSKRIFNTIGQAVSKFAKYSKKISVPKTLLKYLDESCSIEEFFSNFTHVHEISFRDMRDSDVQNIIHILKQCNNVESLSFYHTFFTESNLAMVLDIYSDAIYVPPTDYSVYFSDDIMEKKPIEPANAMVYDEFDFYSDILSPSVPIETTLESNKKRENNNLFIEDELDSKKRKTDPPKLKKLSFRSISLYHSSCKSIREILEYNSTDMHGVELNFSFNEMSSVMANEMLSGESIRNITRLILTENNVENDFLIHLSSQKDFFKSIKHLDLSNNNFVGTIGVNALFTALNNYSSGISLEHLNISHNKLGGTDLLNDNYRIVHQNEFSKLIEYLNGPNCNLKELLISNCDLTQTMVESLLLAVANNSSLTTLDISNTHSLRLCGSSLSLMITSNSPLKKMSISTCSLNEISDSLFNSLLSNTSLRYLDLSGNRFKEYGGKNILTYLRTKIDQQLTEKRNKHQPFHLNTLDLSSNTLTEQFCLQLTQLFASHSTDTTELLDKHYLQANGLPLIDILQLENNFFSPHLTLRLKQAALDSFIVNRIVLTNEDGSSEVFSNVCDGTTLT
ncbi:predicted protein [Naegleria gruberi]|uniref:Predicted protein n=1 Tax=Naegleria gruberi TaxID=5762 RepID=D2VZX1_NAEGR|nr:uncharacterized protein NAEGRDRAFT_74648 [Naegleria gruberi]EFC37606.1 predicted protein [Naegleria gruberi]|eukprot:XP_002670350.1 predicted protein [Naegleria gruberi strain NEG-M]